MADKSQGGLGSVLGNIGSGFSHALSNIGGDVSSLFGGSPSSSQAAQTFSPSTGSIAAGVGPTSTAPLPAFSVSGGGGASAHAFDPGAFTGGGTHNIFPITPSVADSGAFAPAAVNTPAALPTTPDAAQPSGTFAAALKRYALPAAVAIGTPLIQNQQNKAALKPFREQLAKEQQIADNARQVATAEQQGILPPAAQQTLQHNLDAARAAIQARYAAMGMTGSTAEAQDLQALNDQAISQQFQLGQQMAGQGLAEAAQGDASTQNLLDYIAQTEAAQGTALGDIISQFASMFVPAGQVSGG